MSNSKTCNVYIYLVEPITAEDINKCQYLPVSPRKATISIAGKDTNCFKYTFHGQQKPTLNVNTLTLTTVKVKANKIPALEITFDYIETYTPPPPKKSAKVSNKGTITPTNSPIDFYYICQKISGYKTLDDK